MSNKNKKSERYVKLLKDVNSKQCPRCGSKNICIGGTVFKGDWYNGACNICGHIWDKTPIMCKDCMHRADDYCKAYKEKITDLEIENCKRKKEVKSKE